MRLRRGRGVWRVWECLVAAGGRGEGGRAEISMVVVAGCCGWLLWLVVVVRLDLVWARASQSSIVFGTLFLPVFG